jgi:hypothetical protein
MIDAINTNNINTNESTDLSHIQQKCHQLFAAVFLLIESLCRTMYVLVELLIFMISKMSPKVIKWTRIAIVYGCTSGWKVVLLFWHSSLLLKYCVTIITLLSVFMKIFYSYNLHIQLYECCLQLTSKTKQCYYNFKNFLFRFYSRMVSFAIECKRTIFPFLLFLSLPFLVDDYYRYSILNICHVFAPVTFCCIILLRYCLVKNDIEQMQHSTAYDATSLNSTLDYDETLHELLDTTLVESHASTKKHVFMSARAVSLCLDYWISMTFTHLFFNSLFIIFKKIIIPSCLTGCGIPSYALVDRHCSIQYLHLKKYTTRWFWIQSILCRNFKKIFFFLHDACYALLLILLLTIQSKRLTRLREFLCSLFDTVLFFITGTHFSFFYKTSVESNLKVKKITSHLSLSNPHHGVFVSMLRYVMSTLPNRINFLLQFVFHIPQLLLLCLPSFLLPFVIFSLKTFYPAILSLQSLSQNNVKVQAYWISYFVLVHIYQYICYEYIPFSSVWVYVPFKNHITLIWLIFLQVICLNGIPLYFLSSLCISSSQLRPKKEQSLQSSTTKTKKLFATLSLDTSSNTNDENSVSSPVSYSDFQKDMHHSYLNSTEDYNNKNMCSKASFSLFNTGFKANDSIKTFDPNCTNQFIPSTLVNSMSSSVLNSPTYPTKKASTCRIKRHKKRTQQKNMSLH